MALSDDARRGFCWSRALFDFLVVSPASLFRQEFFPSIPLSRRSFSILISGCLVSISPSTVLFPFAPVPFPLVFSLNALYRLSFFPHLPRLYLILPTLLIPVIVFICFGEISLDKIIYLFIFKNRIIVPLILFFIPP